MPEAVRITKLSKEEQPNEDLHQTFKNSLEVTFVFICAELPSPKVMNHHLTYLFLPFLSEVINAFFE